MTPIYVAVGVLVVGLLWFIGTINRFNRLKNLVKESWADVDVVLKRRHDLIPNLVATVKGYAAHEQAVFEQVALARENAVKALAVDHQSGPEEQLVLAVNKLFAVAEAYPDLKASTQFASLMAELRNSEDRIAAARRFYNANVRDFNSMIQSFPTSMIGSGMGLKELQFFEIDDLAVRAVPTV